MMWAPHAPGAAPRTSLASSRRRMNRRPAAGVADRHALLTAHAYPGASTARGPTPSGGAWGNSSSPFETPYAQRAAGGAAGQDEVGAPKKEPGHNAGFVSLFGGSTAQQQSAADLEEQNDARLEGLSERIKLLKDISMGIGREVRESTGELNSLGDVFSNTSAFLGNTFNRMNNMARRQKGWFCNMMLFLLLVVWIFVRATGRGADGLQAVLPLVVAALAPRIPM